MAALDPIVVQDIQKYIFKITVVWNWSNSDRPQYTESSSGS